VVAMVPPLSSSALPQSQPVRPVNMPLTVNSEPVEAGD